jgi:amino-acid N-acetyltransferase
MRKVTFEELVNGDFETVVSLLTESGLDYSDLEQPGIRLFRMLENGLVTSVGGLEIRDGQALLRSVAVKKEFRGKGLGTNLVVQIEKAASESGIQSLYLLTTTASGFFQSIGYRQINRDDFAEPLKQTAQFAGLCPVSAICMKKEL